MRVSMVELREKRIHLPTCLDLSVLCREGGLESRLLLLKESKRESSFETTGRS